MLEQLLTDLIAAIKENTSAVLAAKTTTTEVVLTGTTSSNKDEGGTAATKPAPKAAEKVATKPAPKAAEKPAPKVSESTYTDDDIRAIAKGYLGIDDHKLREQRKEWIVGMIGEFGAAQAVQIPANYRPAFDAWVQEATRTGKCPDYDAYVDGSYLEGSIDDVADEDLADDEV